MHAGYHIGRLFRQGGVRRPRIKFGQFVHVVAMLEEELPLLRVDQNDHVDFVQLQITATGVTEGAYDLAISLPEIGVEFVEGVVD